MRSSDENPKAVGLLGAFILGVKKCGFLFALLLMMFIVLCLMAVLSGQVFQLKQDFLIYLGLAAVIVSLPWSLIGSSVLDAGNVMIPIGVLINCFLLGFFSRLSAHLAEKIDERIAEENRLVAQQVEEDAPGPSQRNH